MMVPDVFTKWQDREWMTVREAAALLNVTPMTVQRYVKSGQLPARRLGTHKLAQIRIRRADVEAFLLPARPRSDK